MRKVHTACGIRLSAAKEKARIGEFALLIPVSQVGVQDRFAADCFHHHPVLPKPQIPAPPLNRPFLWGFSLVSFRSFRLWRHFAVSQPDFSLASLHPKIPFLASGFSTARSREPCGFCRPAGNLGDIGNVGVLEVCAIAADGTQASSNCRLIPPEHREAARC